MTQTHVPGLRAQRKLFVEYRVSEYEIRKTTSKHALGVFIEVDDTT